MKWIVIVCICAVLFCFHICTVIVLAKTKSLLKNKFVCLALILSLSDGTLMLEKILHEVFVYSCNNFNNKETWQYFCLMLKHLVASTIIFSQFQTFLICLERLNATFVVPNRILKWMTNTITIGICFLGMQALSILAFTFTTNTVHDPDEPNGCQPKLTITKGTFIKFDVPNGVLIFLIAICYVIVMIRMKERQKQSVVLNHVTKTQIDRQNKAILNMRKNVITLTFLVLVTFFAILPRTVYGMYCQYREESSPDVITITNNMLLINPLLDPFVYVFRIREFRDRLKCKCLKRNTIGSVTSEIRNLRNSKQDYNSTETGMVNTTSNV